MSNSPLVIEKIVNGGYGLARRENGQFVLLRHVLPGETVTARILAEKKGFAEAALSKIIEASPHRISPPCPKYGTCGGCDLQHCDSEQQLQIKKEIISDLLERAPQNALQHAVPLLADPIASPQPFGYRQRIRLQIDENQQPGFRRYHSHQCVPITECLLARPELNSVLQQLQAYPLFHKILATTTELELLLNPASSRVVCLFHLARKPRPTDMKQAEALMETLPLVEKVLFHGQDFLPCGPSSGDKSDGDNNELQFLLPPFPGHTDKSISLTLEAGGFCQVNLEQNIQLIQTVLDCCQADRQATVLDLFCGMGNFSIPLAMQSTSLLGIEGQGSAIRSARKNSKRAGLTNTLFEKSPIHERCQTLVTEGRSFDCVVIDPPRQGAPGLARQLATLTRKRLVYISCDPATLCRDLGELIHSGFAIIKLQPVDMFPQTHHIETVVLLAK
ncbi:MAG: class I SAM-dependent RNA methyltransferase [Proteobacteria bacterium]|nr:class I SAM-dependent RNA methyltransferase [Pseudomonadota bacterium]MBU1649051.1 class I SAM-dependent RNA methyltransferase [Pseudomonadota bacterium]